MDDTFGHLVKKLGFYPLTDQPGVTEKTIHDFEEELGQPMPDDYREFLLHHGMVAATGLVFPDPNQPSKPGGGVGVFYGLQPGSEYNLLSEWEGTKGEIPPGLLAIADSPGGLICIVLSGDERGAVYWFAAEDSRSGSDDDFYLIAPSFTAFIHSLYLDDS